MCNIVYEDNHLLIAVKPPNVLSQGDATGNDCLLERLKSYIAEKYQKPGAVYLGLVHRMDRPVGGLMAFARTSKAASRLSEQLRGHAMQREYLAVVQDFTLPMSGTLRDFLCKGEDGFVRVVPSETAGAQEARLAYTLLARDEGSDTVLLHICLETGRKHQIRVQLAHSGHPILYDMRYGKGVRGENIALWGAVLRLEHPTQKMPMTFTSMPQGSGFAPFTAIVEAFLSEQGGQP